MSLLEKASLIVTPNAYKESKLYSVVPSSGAGDMTVVRATTATRVNSAGLIEIVPRNLQIYSNDFTNAIYLKIGTTINSNVTIAPDGSTTADKMVEDTSNGFHTVDVIQSGRVAGDYTISVFAKAAERTKFQILGFLTLTGNVDFDLVAGTATTVAPAKNGKIEAYPNGWYRCSATFGDLTGLAAQILCNILNDAGSNGYAGNGTSGLFLWGYQLEQGSSATEYFPTTDRLNIPRIDYSNGSCPSLLVEGQRTNLATYSNDFSNATWIKRAGLSITPNYSISPDGTLNASRALVSSGDGYLWQNFTFIQGNTYTISTYAKGIGSMRHIAYWGSGVANSSLKTLTSNWQKFTFTFTVTSIVSIGDVGISFTNDAQIFGFQLEQGTYPTSYIPTVASSVTRNADVISKTGISSLIGQTEGTLYAEIKVSKLIGTASRYIFHVSDGTTNNRIYIAFSGSSSNVLRARIFNGGTLQCTINTSALTNTGTYKLALAYKNNDIVFYVNGVQIGTDTSATIPTCSRVDLGQNYAGASQLSDNISLSTLFKTRLTNAELATLTTI